MTEPLTTNEPLAEDPHLGGILRIGDRPVRRLGFGTARILWSDAADTVRHAVELLRDVVDAGVTLLDTADCYDLGAVEETIAMALRPYPDDLVIATKGGLVMGPGWADGTEAPRDGRPEALRAACEGSLRRLGTECIDLYQLHTPDPTVPLEESVGALADLQRDGKVRHVGLSNVGRRELAAARSVTAIVSVQNRFNLDATSSARVLGECERAGIAFLPYEPAMVRPTEVRRAVAARHRTTVHQVAIAWALRTSPVTCPLPGTSSRAHAIDNLAAASVELSPEDLDALGAEAA